MNSAPIVVFLDRDTLPVPLKPISSPHRWQSFPHSTPEQVIERLQGASVVITNKVVITREMIAALPELRLIAVAATGFNIIDVAAAREHTVGVCNIRDYAIHGVAEHTLMLMLALRRQLLAYRARLLAGEWQKAAGFCLFPESAATASHDLAGSRMAIIGSGALGQATAKLAQAFGMQTYFVERKGAAQVRVGYLAWDEAIQTADVISLHCPLNDQTRNLIGAAELAQMKTSAIVINTSRGGLIDEAALLQALQQGQIAGAGLDVLITEPPRAGNALLDIELPNLIITPHVAWASVETMQTLADQLIDNVDGFLQGQPRNLL
ncbi:D-2-hydroxyacid dehydrogenase [Chitinibacter bivalviorum]|uniref:D-2-hydroxyacid dehydrogenase n=1 Tax=Chitinibacter bivalviorum TaxID=2739434 RepID=A0A7H9BGE8_9NEIS|nr:D-2-hydroxyacid dehydrogenase [Chitinibacter bivalviorum]QLG87336.1 D-2-hydroxyacid dehydrogenase [Chitinibacter bivalviorum]